jgi:hypothetical protein
MADDEIGGGLLGSASKFGSDVWSGLSGLLGGGAAPTTGQQQDMLAMLSPEDQRRLGLSMLGQLGSTLLAAGQRQTGAQRAEKLAQLGNIGTNIEQSIVRNAMLQQQRQAAQRQAELFAPQLTSARAMAAEKEIALRQMQETVSAQENLRKLRDENPEALAKDLGIDNVGLIKTMPIDQLLTITKEVAVKKAMRSPLEMAAQAEIAKSLGIGQQGQAMQPVVAPVAAPVAVPVAPAMGALQVGIPAPADNMALDYSRYPETGRPPVAEAPTVAAPSAPATPGGVVSMPTPTNPEAARLRALASNPLINAADPAKAKAFAELADKIDPAGAVKAAERIELNRAEMRINQPKVEQALAGQMLQSKNVLDTINRAQGNVSKWSAGRGSLLAVVPETQARDLQSDLATIKANLGFEALNTIRQNSATGGALGPVSEKELVFLQSTIDSLDQAKSPDDLKRALSNIATKIRAFQTLKERAYEKDYGQKFDLKKFAGEDMGEGQPSPGAGAQPAATIPVVNSPAEARKLPSGTVFMTPDGRRKVVP